MLADDSTWVWFIISTRWFYQVGPDAGMVVLLAVAHSTGLRPPDSIAHLPGPSQSEGYYAKVERAAQMPFDFLARRSRRWGLGQRAGQALPTGEGRSYASWTPFCRYLNSFKPLR